MSASILKSLRFFNMVYIQDYLFKGDNAGAQMCFRYTPVHKLVITTS